MDKKQLMKRDVLRLLPKCRIISMTEDMMYLCVENHVLDKQLSLINACFAGVNIIIEENCARGRFCVCASNKIQERLCEHYDGINRNGWWRVFKDLNLSPARYKRPAPTFNQILEVISGIT